MSRGQIGFEMLIVFAIAITLVIWSAKLVDSLSTGSVQEKIQVNTLKELVNSACSTQVKFASEVVCSFEKGQTKSYDILTQDNAITVVTGEKSAGAATLCAVEGGPIQVNCENAKLCFNYNAGRVAISSGDCSP